MDTDLESPLIHPANPNHLPDHLFTAVFSRKISSPHHSSSRGKEAILSSTKQRARKQRRAVRDAKEIAIGYAFILSVIFHAVTNFSALPPSNRTFAVLSKSQKNSRIPSASATVPSKKIQNFVDRSLLLKGGKSAVRGWERRPANIGVLRRVGPAAQFVRDK
ncbi:hypothetical protein FISHEDRAFT_40056 [Fistulina hepatica ATCC 64428]|uniref:Transmembrane protein n=1 Tax=Fistulina hepatica ATCC 64428 TaxID=1128425 RepID=A0A0D7AFY9_9AGAR|nr:hypothetical protein FISHEDRAFT_40056 [Fistulina hepatica ATCC 64428]